MYTAIMTYPCKPEHVSDAADYWMQVVLDKARQQPGFVRMQLYTREEGTMMAMGTWKEKKHAEDFMQTGIFKKLTEGLNDWLAGTPTPLEWDIVCFAQNEKPFYR